MNDRPTPGRAKKHSARLLAAILLCALLAGCAQSVRPEETSLAGFSLGKLFSTEERPLTLHPARLPLGENRPYAVRVSADGVSRLLVSANNTVAELLEKAGVELGEHDRLSHEPTLRAGAGEHIVVTRIRYEDETRVETIPYETREKHNCLIAEGRRRVLVEGRDGEASRVYRRRYENGELVGETLYSEKILRYALDELVLVGSDDPVSDMQATGWPVDEQGRPTVYQQLLTDQIATGYHARIGQNRGASGMKLYSGFAAVRSAQIPYGTVMYVASRDNEFVYGYCVAADTGIGLMDNVIDIDLFYETYLESCLNGRKIVDIYILGQMERP